MSELDQMIVLLPDEISVTSTQTLEWIPEKNLFEGTFELSFAKASVEPVRIVSGTNFAWITVRYPDPGTNETRTISINEIAHTNFPTGSMRISFGLPYLETIVLYVGPHTIQISPVITPPSTLFLIKCKIRSEKQIVQELMLIDPSEEFLIAAMFPQKSPGAFLGYWCLETTLNSPEEVSRKLRLLRIPHKILGTVAEMGELFRYGERLDERQQTLQIGDTVIILVRPFKNEKAKIIEMVEKDERKIVVQLINTGLPVPITLDRENVRLLETEST